MTLDRVFEQPRAKTLACRMRLPPRARHEKRGSGVVDRGIQYVAHPLKENSRRKQFENQILDHSLLAAARHASVAHAAAVARDQDRDATGGLRRSHSSPAACDGDDATPRNFNHAKRRSCLFGRRLQLSRIRGSPHDGVHGTARIFDGRRLMHVRKKLFFNITVFNAKQYSVARQVTMPVALLFLSMAQPYALCRLRACCMAK